MHNISIPGRDGFQGRLGRKGKPYGKRDGIAVCSPCNSNGFNFVDPSGDSWKAGPDALGIETKLNLFGNDTFQKPGSTALAILTAIDIPTVRNGVGEKDVEGSVALPFAIKLTENLELMTKYVLQQRVLLSSGLTERLVCVATEIATELGSTEREVNVRRPTKPTKTRYRMGP